ncbi:hypothetical protein O181_095684 [Austropuccinia psidii MF-1]|uniref:Uncharacterized protein n=1 Tax=Austropuccinia psidii MF-1 TaxID=1389203 RepID=A0A9Q3J5T0_9BASI|nr:hypothetical protein [Austropuccinia psidii MF-1]
MSHTLTYHSIKNVQQCHHHVGKGIGPYPPAPKWAHTHTPAQVDAHANATTPADAHAHANATTVAEADANATAPEEEHANATTPHWWYSAPCSTSVIRKMTIMRRRSPFMDDLVRSNPPSTSRLAEGPL